MEKNRQTYYISDRTIFKTAIAWLLFGVALGFLGGCSTLKNLHNTAMLWPKPKQVAINEDGSIRYKVYEFK